MERRAQAMVQPSRCHQQICRRGSPISFLEANMAKYIVTLRSGPHSFMVEVTIVTTTSDARGTWKAVTRGMLTHVGGVCDFGGKLTHGPDLVLNAKEVELGCQLLGFRNSLVPQKQGEAIVADVLIKKEPAKGGNWTWTNPTAENAK